MKTLGSVFRVVAVLGGNPPTDQPGNQGSMLHVGSETSTSADLLHRPTRDLGGLFRIRHDAPRLSAAAVRQRPASVAATIPAGRSLICRSSARRRCRSGA